ncbi:sulfite exporter TauE/SafE family protein [Flavobacterium davisii]|uniref:sulfite exporter TauE/SafE family protein n=1 Tax=Flavobacterium davisii TaxID=2906077 RepID=UPI0035CE93AA
MTVESNIFLLLITVIGFLYASVGHGGASGYLALMSLFSFSPEMMKPSALVLNILVSSVAFLFFYRSNQFRWDLFYPFAITSIPLSFIGGFFKIETHVYKIILGIILLFAAIRIISAFRRKENQAIKAIQFKKALLIGAIVGFISGILGIGGGIILGPIILLLGWGNMKETAAVSALFILVNSISGILGFLANNGIFPTQMARVILVVFMGGTLGAFYGSTKFNNTTLKYILSFVLVIASAKLIMF